MFGGILKLNGFGKKMKNYERLMQMSHLFFNMTVNKKVGKIFRN